MLRKNRRISTQTLDSDAYDNTLMPTENTSLIFSVNGVFSREFSVGSSSSVYLNLNHPHRLRFAGIPSNGGNQKSSNLKIAEIHMKAHRVCCKLEGIHFEERSSPAQVYSSLPCSKMVSFFAYDC